MTRFEAIKQGHIKIVDISIVCNFTVDKCELNPAYVIKNIDSPKDLLNGQKNGPHQRTVLLIRSN
ncbi:hypothetical protein AUS35_05335 [Escherichia coli]|uniref:Uncharacterized protein n=1 Tax=Escherichia coli ISC7 TaxID=1432555 RepID=W1F4B5_ECOLX|nr:hypothetical protein ECDEC9A_0042 [Escherichia coli DEC9A]EHW65975.1 hypothetical protein ECDEC9E_0030 [Escherichia coli DEC9E]EHW81553.1 hypothetical protein ECDEC10C_0174 [Escherichia coli DEC10C]KIO40413.1 hypothetical protein SU67_12415 [Escherichia coli O139:H28 str. E24377A]KXK78554.1 hypothetical protein AUS13_16845 [Escherichia coli]CDL29181.1 orf; Unknown function [Escherichia coli ISC7]